MGMFDTFNVHKVLLQGLLDEEYENRLDTSSDDSEYYTFQTKSLDCCLTTYYLDDDGCLYQTKYSALEDDYGSASNLKFPVTAVTDYITFHDLFSTDEYQIWIDIRCHIRNGVLQDHFEIVSIQKTPISELQTNSCKIKEVWSEVEQMPLYKVLKVIKKIRLIVTNLFHKIERFLDERTRGKHFPR